MTLMRRQSLRESTKGAALVEFAMILPVLLLFIMGSLELGFRLYGMSAVNGSLREAARMASTGDYTGAQIDAKVIRMLREFKPDARISIVKQSYSDFTGVGLPEPVTTGTVESGTYCYDDINNNGRWDQDRGRSGLGGSEDVIYYEVTFEYDTLMEFTKYNLGLPDVSNIKQNTIVSNEPFAAVVRTPPANRCV